MLARAQPLAARRLVRLVAALLRMLVRQRLSRAPARRLRAVETAIGSRPGRAIAVLVAALTPSPYCRG